MQVIQQIWEENKKFLLTVGGGFALFLILKSCAVESFVGHAGTLHEENQKKEGRINYLRNELIRRAPEEEKNLEDLLEIEKEVSRRYLTPPPEDVPDPRRGSPQLQFSERIDKVWSELRSMANQKNVKIPEKITTQNLDVFSEDSPVEHERSTSYLEILDRAMKSCVQVGMVQIAKPVLAPEEGFPIQENEDIEMVYRSVGLTVDGPYKAFKELLRTYQEHPFAQARLIKLSPMTTLEPGILRGQVQFVGIHMEKEAEGGEVRRMKKGSARRKPSSRASTRWKVRRN